MHASVFAAWVQDTGSCGQKHGIGDFVDELDSRQTVRMGWRVRGEVGVGRGFAGDMRKDTGRIIACQ